MDVPLQRQRMAVIEVAAEGLGVELVGEGLARLHQPGARNAVHARGMDAVEVHRVRVGRAVGEMDAEPLALGAAERRAGHAAVIGPGRKEHARRHLDLDVAGGDRPFAHPPAVLLADSAHIPVGEHLRADRSRCGHGRRCRRRGCRNPLRSPRRRGGPHGRRAQRSAPSWRDACARPATRRARSASIPRRERSNRMASSQPIARAC